MKKLIFVVLVGLLSCEEKDIGTNGLTGKYIETSPVAGRTQLIFAFGKVTEIEIEDGVTTNSNTYLYQVSSSKIKLTPASFYGSGCELDFKIVNPSKFIIDDLYPELLYNHPIGLMTFEK